MPHPAPKRLTVPTFESNLPAELLKGLDERGKYLYTTMDKMSQAQGWLLTHAVDHGNKLEAVREQAAITNGRLLKAEGDIKAIAAAQEEAKPTLETAVLAKRVILNRWFWIATAGVVLIGLPWLVANAPLPGTVLKWAFTLLVG